MHSKKPLKAAIASAWIVSAAMAVSFASAGEFLLGVGIDDVCDRANRGRAVAFGLEVRGDAVWTSRWAWFGFGFAAESDGDGDFWGGAGPVLYLRLSDSWRLESSIMPGLYSKGVGNDLGTSAPMFQGQIGTSYRIAPQWRLGLSLGHKSNAGTATRNPGVETLLCTLGRSF